MEIWTVNLCAVLSVLARIQLIVIWMILLFFPPMRMLASILQFASVCVGRDKIFCFPVGALILAIVEQMWLSAEVLPVVGVVALGLVVFLVEGAPFGLEVEHVEVGVLLHEVDYPRLYVLHRVRKRTVLTVLALRQHTRELCAELSLVLLYVVQSLHLVVCEWAVVLKLARVCIFVFASLRGVESFVLSASVLQSVEEGALLMYVVVVLAALLHLELFQVQVPNHLSVYRLVDDDKYAFDLAVLQIGVSLVRLLLLQRLHRQSVLRKVRTIRYWHYASLLRLGL
mmetsp:Transcript_7054/g.5302  ORF Transcript_7054/g.5302 Transcript_7054/m.5302 type:complete len:284 (-) Transcript_7054:950-1801(-)